MSLKIKIEDKAMSGKRCTPGKRLYLNTAGNKLVKEGHADAATLFCSEFGSVSQAKYDRLMPKKKPAKKK